MKKVTNFVRKYYFVVVVLAAILLKCIITTNLSINARDPYGADEYLMLRQAEQLASGNYLGPYDNFTLVKGIGFPLFLAFSYKIGIPLLLFYSIFYSAVCVIALLPIRRIVKKRPLQLLAFLALLFCPAAMDNNVQLIYRNMLIIPQSVLLISALMMMFYHVNDKKKTKLILWSLVASATWVFMWHTREDTIWSLPLLAATWIVLLIGIVKGKTKKIKCFSKEALFRIGVITLPFICLFISIQIISLINYNYYGVYTTNQLNSSNYTKAVTTMMRVKPTEEIERVEITRDTLLRLYEVSPSLKTLEDVIEADYKHKRGLVAASEDNGEINEDLITWELTGAAGIKGYYQDAQTAEKFWEDVYNEINGAIEEGKLETRQIMPSRSLIPFPNKPDSFGKLLNTIVDLYARAARYDCSNVEVFVANVDSDTVRRYEAISGGYVVEARENSDVPDALELKATRWTGYVNRIRKIYGIISPVLLCVGLLYYVVLAIVMIIKAIKKQDCYFDRWLFLSMVLGSLTAILIGLGYVEAFMVGTYGYLASCNGLLNLFVVLTTVLLVQDAMNMVSYLKRRSSKKPRHVKK